MEHLLLKAVTSASTDRGEFTAVISTATIDREKDIVDPAGFVRALRKWVPLGKKLPLAWNHSTRPEDQVGYVDPATARVEGTEVVADGKVDLDTPNGAHAWRCVKAGTLGFSFGYLVPTGGSTPRKGGGRHIRELDVFEVSASPTPMNSDTRVLSWKAVKASGTVGPHARFQLRNLIKYYMGKPHPFGSCVADNTKRFGPEGADKVCLVGDTPVDTPDGQTCIADLRVGDLVWSYSEASGHFELKPVVWHGLTRRNATVVRVTLENGAQVVATPDHPFLRYNGEWAAASSLREGEFLLGPHAPHVLPLALKAVPVALADPVLSDGKVLRPEVTLGASGVLPLGTPPILDHLVRSDDLSDLRFAPGGHPGFDYAHYGDSGMSVDLPLVSRLAALSIGRGLAKTEDSLEPIKGFDGILAGLDRGVEAAAMKGTIAAPPVGNLIPTEASLTFEKASGPSDVRGCQVAEVVVLEEGKDVWDIEVADNHTFVVHGSTVVHNCATLKDLGVGSTRWRHGGNRGKAVDTAATTDAAPSDQDMEAMCQSLYDASGGNLEALLEMWWAHMQENGDTPKALSPEDTVREADEISREFALRGSRKQADTDSEDEDDPAELLGGMIATAQDFIDDEDDPADVAVMRQVMVLLLRLQSEEATEPPEQDDTGKSIPVSDVVRDEARRLSRMLPRTDPSAAELEALRTELAEQTKRLEGVQEELDSARKQLSERGEDLDMLKRAGDALTLDAVRRTRRRDRKSAEKPDVSEWVVPAGELEGAKNGSLKAVWTTAYLNSLPDSSFLLVESGGDKDSEGKTTPRSLRHFPYKDANGAVDLPHLRNALARIPQSNLPADVKEKLQARAQRILDNQKALAVDPDVAVDVTGKEPSARSVDPLVQQARALALEFQSKGISRRKPPREEKPAPKRPELDEDELRREMRDLMFTALQAR